MCPGPPHATRGRTSGVRHPSPQSDGPDSRASAKFLSSSSAPDRVRAGSPRRRRNPSSPPFPPVVFRTRFALNSNSINTLKHIESWGC
ncbi:hypothetical protein GUJ93_ZPchr0009g618 [Zizania palustris]|uniref:Uncharacterized protein n=1 Tax=Zizania palustris TaxID=103762 RepID=A0A8J5V6H3_ZIZPA|nr:hypothetical protein GUJ93_ZPchr0009g618 [Zizania palustris]